LWLAAASSSSTATAEDSLGQKAARAEAAAFTAIEQKQWCEAKNLFLEADRFASSADFLLNAAMAADRGNDRGGAAALYERIAAAPGPRSGEAKKRLAALNTRMSKEGPGTPCAALATQEAPADGSTPPSSDGLGGPPMWPLAIAGVSGGVLVLGGAAAVLGLVPWLQHGSAASALREAESQRETNAKRLGQLQEDQSAARAAWESWGQVTTIAGAVGAGVGAVGVAVGIALFAVAEPE
jgi:hypothetical protein